MTLKTQPLHLSEFYLVSENMSGKNPKEERDTALVFAAADRHDALSGSERPPLGQHVDTMAWPAGSAER